MRTLAPPRPPDGGWPSILTFEEARVYARLSEKKFRDVLKRGEIRYKREGRTILIARAEIDSWVMTPAGLREKSLGADY
jgi:excisionase family DNA binding protein